MFKKNLPMTIFLFSLFIFTSVILAAENRTEINPPVNQGHEIEISDRVLDRFVETTKNLNEIRTDYTKKINDTEDKKKKKSLGKEAQNKMIASLEDGGFTPDDYNIIIGIIQQNPELQRIVHEKMNN